MKGFYTVGLLLLSNAFMTLAWYGHLKFREMDWLKGLGLLAIILISWGIAFFEYLLQVPANRIGFRGHGGPFSLMELKIIQEVISLSVFIVFTLIVFRTETIRWNHIAGMLLIVGAVYLVFHR
ncbi:MAG: DMT family protein [Bacteroidales bacterium]|nr:DMT family protein [Bacteroidales bacterium]